ncbi:MAG: OmpH family outer membrane protein [Planctomycetes bacterium]|nr:OmpH family outer membrane protein [Planctomycetota bacterium]
MKKFLISLAAVAALGGVFWGVNNINAQQGAPMGGAPTASPQPARPRIALVNIAKVLREFNKANADGQMINTKRQEYVDRVRPYREKLAAMSRQIQSTVNPDERAKLTKEATAIQRSIEDVDNEAQKVLGELTDRTIVEVYQNIKTTIGDIATANNLDLVMCYPDGSSPEDDKKAAVAQLKLQTPALIPFYHRGMDISEVVVVTLNKRHPAPPVALKQPTTPMPMQPITPVGK